MQIQRIQSLLLLVAAILVGLFCITPFAEVMGPEGGMPLDIYPREIPSLLILNALIAVLLFLIIFMFKNLKLQKRMTVLSILLLCVSVVTSGFIMYAKMDNTSPILYGGVSLLLLAVVFAVLALKFINRDHQLLHSYDRLR